MAIVVSIYKLNNKKLLKIDLQGLITFLIALLELKSARIDVKKTKVDIFVLQI